MSNQAMKINAEFAKLKDEKGKYKSQ